MGRDIRASQTVSSIPYGFDRYGRPLRIWRKRRDLSLGEALRYPVIDGPGIALMVLLPPFLSIMTLPSFDMIVHFKPGNVLSPFHLIMIPFALPLVFCSTLTIGYALIFLGRILVAAASGQDDHPRLPIWDRVEILEELVRWTWAGLLGLAIGGLPALSYWKHCGPVEWYDLVVFVALALVGIAYSQMSLMTALLHETLTASNPETTLRSIARIGIDYAAPCLVTTTTALMGLAGWWMVLLHSPSPEIGLLGLWAGWVLTLYSGMMVMRVLGTLYYKNESRLAWFRTTRG